MRNTWKISAWLCGLGILLAPAVVQSAVAYRTSGVACQPEIAGSGQAEFLSESGLQYSLGQAPVIACSLPTSEDTFLPTTLSQVNVRYYFNGAATVTGRIVFHDYDSPDFVECGEDVDNVTSTGYHTLELSKSCGLSSYASNWAVVAAVETSGMDLVETLNVKLVSVHD